MASDRLSCCFVTIGCAKNEVDTDRMRALLAEADVHDCGDPSLADVVIVNTCSFLSIATQESVETVLEMADVNSHDRSRPPIIMCGCVPSRYGDVLAAELPEVAAFVPADKEDGIVDVVLSVLGLGTTESSEREHAPLRTVEGPFAYVKISDGCDRFCTFCAIPYIRGRYFSRTADEICGEVAHLMKQGVREIVLIGQDTGIWGYDLDGGEHDLAWLLERVADEVRPYDGWVRVLYLQPEGMSQRLIDTMRDVPEVLPYIDIPVQHCNERILKLMGRAGDEQSLKALFRDLRERIPGMTLRSTGLVGFPSETDEEFEQLVEFVDEVGFDYVSVFPYSQEEGTVAASLEGQLDEEQKLERAQRLIDVTEQLGFAATASHVGETVDVLIDGIDHDGERQELIGHTWFQAPDCDGAVHIESGDARVGDMVRCRLVDSFCYELVGEIA